MGLVFVFLCASEKTCASCLSRRRSSTVKSVVVVSMRAVSIGITVLLRPGGSHSRFSGALSVLFVGLGNVSVSIW